MVAFRSGPRTKKPDSTMKPERAESPDERGKEKSGVVPVKKIKEEFPDASPQKVARLQTMLGDKTTPMKKERLFEGDKGRRKKIMKKAAKAAVKALTPFKSGGRAMYKSGSKGCKLAMKGKGRAYGKNS